MIWQVAVVALSSAGAIFGQQASAGVPTWGSQSSLVIEDPAGSSRQLVPEPVAISAQGRPITALRIGPGDAATRLVIIGQVHGNESAGVRIVRDLIHRSREGSGLDDGSGLATWMIASLNPDGRRTGDRVNADGVDLNRNFPASWRQEGAGTRLWSGPAPASEPEVRGLMEFLERIQPTAVLVLHQDFAVVDLTHVRSRRAGRHLADLLGLPARPVGCPGKCHGTLTEWVDRELGSVALTVELPGKVSPRQVGRYAGALEAFATWLGDGVPR